MKKNPTKLTLARETLRTLDGVDLIRTPGGKMPATYTACNGTGGCSPSNPNVCG